jgi:integrase
LVWARDGCKPIHLHDLRHPIASRLGQRGAPLNTVRDLLGHSTVKMSLRDAHQAPDQRREAVARQNEKPILALTLRLPWEGVTTRCAYPLTVSLCAA